jgi:mono/diheme cytochrome c family protein
MRKIWFSFLMIVISSCSNDNTNTPATKSLPQKTADLKEVRIDGKMIYKKHCMECHQENGEGVPNIYPTLKNAEWVGAEKDHLIEIIINGMTKQIVVNGIAYEDEMPKADYLTNKEIAAVLTYIRTSFADIPDPISEVDVAKTRIRLKSKK